MYVGGIMGYTDALYSTEMTNLKNTANITGNEYVGGIIGAWNTNVDTYYSYSVSISSFENSGTIKGTGNYVGGIAGYLYFNNDNGSYYNYTVYLSDLTNTGSVTGNKYVGGLIGYGETDSTSSSIIDYVSTGKVTGSSYAKKVGGKLVNLTAS
jgi:hypothetical protein